VIPAPQDPEAPVGALVLELTRHLGEAEVVAMACDLLGGTDRATYAERLPYLARLADTDAHPEEWSRVWGARALLYAWDDSATGAVLGGLDDEAWRVAEMCLKVAVRRDLPQAADGAASLAAHELPRVRGQAVRLLGVAGDTEHLPAVRAALDDPDGDVRRRAARALDLMELRLDLPEGRR
jgi:HEAT repeat protein